MDTRQKSEIVFKEFLDLIQNLTSHDNDLQHKLQKCYDRTNPHFRWSRGFINLVSLCSEKIRDMPEKRLLLIKEFIDELNNYKAKPLKHLIKTASCVSDSDGSSADESPVLNNICMRESPKLINVREMDVAGYSEDMSEGYVVGKNGAVDGQGEKRKHIDGMKGLNAPSTANVSEADSRKKKRMFYNSTSLSGLLATPYPRMGYVKRPCTKISAIPAADIICLDDDDGEEEEVEEVDDNDDDVVEDGLLCEKANGLKSVDINQEKEQSLSKATDFNVQSSVVTFKPCLVLPKSSDNTVGVGNHPDHLRTTADVLYAGKVEIICLDDDDDDDDDEEARDVSDEKEVGKKEIQSQKIGSIPVERLVTTPLLTRTGVDLDVIEISDADENRSHQKMLRFVEIEKPSSLETMDNAAQQIPEVQSNDLCIDHSEHILNDGTIDAAVTVAFHTKASNTRACDAVEDDNTSIKTESSQVEMILMSRQVAYQGHAGDEMTLGGQIRHLEHQLQKLGSEIQRLHQTELTLEDMNSSVSDYIKTERLEGQFLKVWKKLCSITHRPTFTGRMIEKRFSVEVAGYPDIGKEVSEFINKDRMFPDYQDIYSVVAYCNDKYHLCLKEAAVESLSRTIFTNVGNRLQLLRKMDLDEQMKIYLPDALRSYDDPAIYDQNLYQKLEESQALGRINLEQVFKTFSEKQDTEVDTLDNDANKILDKDEDKAINEDDADEDDDDNDGDDENNDYDDEIDNDEGVLTPDFGHPSSEAEAYSDLELSNTVFEARNNDVTKEDDDHDDERSTDKEICFISFDNGNSETDEIAAASTYNTGNDCNKTEEQTSSCRNASRSVIIIDEESDASNKESTNYADSKEQHTLKCSQLKIRSDLLDNIRRMTSNISFNHSSNQAQNSRETAETSIDYETNEKNDRKSTDKKEMDVHNTGTFHIETNAHLPKKDRERISSSDLPISNQESQSNDKAQREAIDNKRVKRSRTHLNMTYKETIMWSQDDAKKMKELDVNSVKRKDVSSSAAGINAADMPVFSNFAPNISLEMASASCPAAQVMYASNMVDVAAITTLTKSTGLMFTTEYLNIPLLEMVSQANDTSQDLDETRSGETTTQINAMVLPFCDEAAAEVKNNVSNVHRSTAEPTTMVSAVTEVAHTSDVVSEAQVPLSLDDNAVKTNNDVDFCLGSSNSFHNSNASADMVLSRCSNKSNVEDLLNDEICLSSDFELRLDSSSEAPQHPKVPYFSPFVDPKKPISEDAAEKPKGLLDVLRQASKRELLAETSSLNLNKSIFEDSISKVEIDAHLEPTCSEEESFSRQQLHLSETIFSSGYNVISEQLGTTHDFSNSTEMLLQENSFSLDPSKNVALHAETKQCEDKTGKGEHHT